MYHLTGIYNIIVFFTLGFGKISEKLGTLYTYIAMFSSDSKEFEMLI